MTTRPKNLRLPQDIAEKIEAQPDQAGFVAAAVRTYGPHVPLVLEQHQRGWRSALAFLMGAGWTLEALRAACEALNSYWTEEGRPARWIALELVDANVATKHEVDPDLWAQLVERVGGSEVEARAVLAVTRAFWCQDPEVDRALGIGG